MIRRAAEPGGPLAQDETALLFKPGLDAAGLVIAVSGGPDSMALMALLARWRAGLQAGPSLHVATIDHGLRHDSAAEAEMVAAAAIRLGLPHVTLHWSADKPKAGLPRAARDARYRLLEAHAMASHASHIVTAHTMDDQAETLLMRMAAGSGPTGLAGMWAMVRRGRIHHWRPLLTVSKARLVASCGKLGVGFVNDPTNQSKLHARSRWRQIMPQLEGEGLTAVRLARLAARQARANEALEIVAAEARGAGQPSPQGMVFGQHQLQNQPREVLVRALAQAIRMAQVQGRTGEDGAEPGRSDSAFHLKLERLETLAERVEVALTQKTAFKASIAGMIMVLDRHFALLIRPESPRRRGRVDSSVIASLGKAGSRA